MLESPDRPSSADTVPYEPGGSACTALRESAAVRAKELLLTPAAAELDDGRRLRLLRKAGCGGFGEAWVCSIDGGASTVVAKFARPTEAARERLAHEETMLRAAAGAGVPRCFGLMRAERGSCLLLEHVRGPTWREFLRRDTRCSRREVLRRPAELAGILARLHGSGVVHGDIKPENILFGSVAPGGARRTWLIDFGMATAAGRPAQRDEGMTLGTRGYLDPLAIGRGHERDRATDLYSLGAMLYEGYAGSPLYDGSDWLEACARARDRGAAFADWCDALVERSLARFERIERRIPGLESLIGDLLRVERNARRRPAADAAAGRIEEIVDAIDD